MDSDQEAWIRQVHNRFRGRLAGFIEALNLPEKHERSLITMMKSLSYDLENSLIDKLNGDK
jgi:hypothetical protein